MEIFNLDEKFLRNTNLKESKIAIELLPKDFSIVSLVKNKIEWSIYFYLNILSKKAINDRFLFSYHYVNRWSEEEQAEIVYEIIYLNEPSPDSLELVKKPISEIIFNGEKFYDEIVTLVREKTKKMLFAISDNESEICCRFLELHKIEGASISKLADQIDKLVNGDNKDV